MSSKNTSQKTINYRRCVLPSDLGRNLQQLLSAALEAIPTPGNRLEPLNTLSTELRCIGSHKVINGGLCGYLTSFERGASQPVISDDPLAASLRLGALVPPEPENGDAPQQYVPGVIYFAIYKNHIAYVATHSMRSQALERHFDWLLKSKTSELPATAAFVLSDEAQKATKEKIRKSHVKAISFGQPLMAEVELEQPKDIEVSGLKPTKQRKAPPKFKPDGPILSLLKSMFDDEAQFEKLGLDEVFDGNLEVWVEIRYPKYQRSKAENSIKLMDTLGVALRDIEGEQVALELENGHKITGQDLKISGSVSVTLQNDKLPDETELLTEMVAWLRQQIANGTIDP